MAAAKAKNATPENEDAPTPSEIIDDQLETAEEEAELLADLPPLRPAHLFRIGHRVEFRNLQLDAMKSGAFGDLDNTGENAGIDTSTAEGIDQYQKFVAFIARIDEWAESIAVNPAKYAAWASGKTERHMLALYSKYKRELGE